ncbi:hypothetical protein [Streptomyces sp. MP131-18]|uniref:hypothetical protein n=1 Tax=Streptomyces sp. MP131-18 TaxID=1857892 RepID=UPI0009D3A839|nr:hypothetical protein [Streptomyces sp. MP131-18]ONK09499.1 hypothetical protein STBA_01990 [Streptomyces sp. MP131-18]
MTEEEFAREYGPELARLELAAVLAEAAVTDRPPRRRWWPRLRLQRAHWPRPGIELAEVADPRCPHCAGEGGWESDYADELGEYSGTETVLCECWNPGRRWLILPLPHRHRGGGYSDEPPF